MILLVKVIIVNFRTLFNFDQEAYKFMLLRTGVFFSFKS